MSFLNVHKRNILDRIPINKRDITPGDIILFRYKGKDGVSEKMVLCLDGLTGKFTRDNLLNALDLDKLSKNILKLFILRVDEPRFIEEERKNKLILSLIVEANTEGERKEFYKDKVSKFVKYGAYRTYTDDNIGSVKLIHYDFGDLGLTE
tara:strand:- start:74 stop:523 length:450 start_codon:yes stop_codon:yes gene_type:complete